MENILDVTDLSKEEQAEKIVAAANDLEDGMRVLVKSNTELQQIIGDLLTSFWGKLQWLPYFNESETWSGYLVSN